MIAPVDPVPETLPPPPPVPPAPADAGLDELPVQEVESRTVHAVPEGATVTIPHVTLQDREGRPLARPAAPAPPPPSYVPSIGPGSSESASAEPPATYRPSAPTRGAQQAALPPAPATLSGPAQATGTVSLAISGHIVRLYGVLPPASSDRCALGAGAPQSCAEVTQAMLAARLARSASITCQLPPGAGATDPARICLDAGGVDIAGYLVSEGLAVADRRANGGYTGAEGVARSYGKGLWHFR
jgi:endonuclease YncB( thermonuclease family)